MVERQELGLSINIAECLWTLRSALRSFFPPHSRGSSVPTPGSRTSINCFFFFVLFPSFGRGVLLFVYARVRVFFPGKFLSPPAFRRGFSFFLNLLLLRVSLPSSMFGVPCCFAFVLLARTPRASVKSPSYGSACLLSFLRHSGRSSFPSYRFFLLITSRQFGVLSWILFSFNFSCPLTKALRFCMSLRGFLRQLPCKRASVVSVSCRASCATFSSSKVASTLLAWPALSPSRPARPRN